MDNQQTHPARRLEKPAKLLLVLHAIFTLAVTLSNLFLNVYLWKIQKDYRDIAVFNLMVFLFTAIAFILAGAVLSRSGRGAVYRAGLAVYAIFFVAILFLREQAVTYVLPIGALLGLASGFYWVAFNVLTFDVTSVRDRAIFFGLNGFATSGVGMLAPLISGYITSSLPDLGGYRLIFMISLALFLITGVISIFLADRRDDHPYELAKVLRSVQDDKAWREVMTGTFFYGIREGIFAFIINLLVYVSTNSEWHLGWFYAINSALGMVSNYTVGRMLNKTNRSRLLFVGAVVMFGAAALLMFGFKFSTLLLFGVVNAIFLPCLAIPFSTITYEVISRIPHAAELRVEYIVTREIFLNLGRVIPVFLLILMFDGNNTAIIKWFLLIPSLALFAAWYFLQRIRVLTRS